MYFFMVIYYKVLKKVENQIFAPKMVVKTPSFETRSLSNLKMDPRVIYNFKILHFKLLDTPIAINTSSKQWIFHV